MTFSPSTMPSSIATLHDDDGRQIATIYARSIQAERQKRLDAFSALKSRYVSIGSPKTYAAVLNLHGVQNANEFQDTPEGLAQARVCYGAMMADVKAREVRGR